MATTCTNAGTGAGGAALRPSLTIDRHYLREALSRLAQLNRSSLRILDLHEAERSLSWSDPARSGETLDALWDALVALQNRAHDEIERIQRHGGLLHVGAALISVGGPRHG